MVDKGTSMPTRYVLSEYLQRAVERAVYEKLDDGTFGGRIPACAGVVAFGDTRQECEQELRSTLEDWLVLGLKMGHRLPVIDDIDLNRNPVREPVDAL